MKALEKDRNRRYATANELQRALDLALPASQWISTDLEVAAFMRQLLGERHEQRRKALNTALRLADERAQGRTSASFALQDMEAVSHSGFTPPSNVSSLVPARELRSSYPTSRYPGLDASPPSSGSGEGINAKTKSTWTSFAMRTFAEPRLALLAIGFGLIVGVGVYEVRKPKTPRPAAEPEPTRVVDPPATPVAEAPEDATIAPIIAIDNVVELSDGGQAPPARAKANSRTASPRATSKAPPAASSTAPKPSSTSFVPPVRNPGF
jgi:serine/threonine-protein kinase